MIYHQLLASWTSEWLTSSSPTTKKKRKIEKTTSTEPVDISPSRAPKIPRTEKTSEPSIDIDNLAEYESDEEIEDPKKKSEKKTRSVQPHTPLSEKHVEKDDINDLADYVSDEETEDPKKKSEKKPVAFNPIHPQDSSSLQKKPIQKNSTLTISQIIAVNQNTKKTKLKNQVQIHQTLAPLPYPQKTPHLLKK